MNWQDTIDVLTEFKRGKITAEEAAVLLQLLDKPRRLADDNSILMWIVFAMFLIGGVVMLYLAVRL